MKQIDKILMRKNKQDVRLMKSFAPTVLIMGAMLIVPVQSVHAQETIDLDSYLDQISETESEAPPSNEELKEEEPQGVFGGVLSEISDIIPVQGDEEAQTQAVDDGDALPNIPNINSRSTQAGMNLPVSSGDPLSASSLGLIEKTPEELEEEIRREAFDAAITGLFPLSTDNIKTLLERNNEIQNAVQEPITGIPTPQIDVETISLDPGVAPMKIRTSAGFITTVSILDVTGAPWPIQDVSWAGDYEVIEPEEGGHILRITPLTKQAYGNMSLRLLTLKTPVTIQLETNPDSVQYRVDARIPEYGPFAETPLIEGSTDRIAGDPQIMSVLDGVAPASAQKLYVSGTDRRTSAYKLGNMTYVRTPLTLISPSWDQSVSSADGMNVYGMRDTPVVLLSDRGRVSRVNLSIASESEDGR